MFDELIISFLPRYENISKNKVVRQISPVSLIFVNVVLHIATQNICCTFDNITRHRSSETGRCDNKVFKDLCSVCLSRTKFIKPATCCVYYESSEEKSSFESDNWRFIPISHEDSCVFYIVYLTRYPVQ